MTTCTVADCNRPHLARGWCSGHYSRIYRHGTLEVSTGPTSCLMDGCTRRPHGRGMCQAHYFRVRRYGSIGASEIGPANGRSSHRWVGDAVSYEAMHHRLRAGRGRADQHRCHACSAQAKDWAYVGGDPDERRGKLNGLRYSTDPSRYVPMCRPCHTAHDGELRAKRPNQLLAHATVGGGRKVGGGGHIPAPPRRAVCVPGSNVPGDIS